MIRRLAEELAAISRHVPPRVFAAYLKALVVNSSKILKKRSLGPADAFLDGADYQVKLDGISYRMRDVPFGLVRELYCREIYFPSPAWRPQAGDLVVDLGANCGSFSVLCAKRGANVIAIEAQSSFAAAFSRLMENNSVGDHVTLVHGLVAPDQEVLDSLGLAREKSAISVRGPELLQFAAGRRIRFIKADVEGCEFNLFDGDLAWLDQVDQISMEIHPTFGEPAALRDRLRQCGFDCWITDKTGAEVDRVKTEVGFCYASRLPASRRAH